MNGAVHAVIYMLLYIYSNHVDILTPKLQANSVEEKQVSGICNIPPLSRRELQIQSSR